MLGLFSYFSLSVSPFLVFEIVDGCSLDLLQLSSPTGRKPPLCDISCREPTETGKILDDLKGSEEGYWCKSVIVARFVILLVYLTSLSSLRSSFDHQLPIT